MGTKRKLVDNFQRIPMLTIKDDLRDLIEGNVASLNGTVAEAINRQISLVREKESKARKLNNPQVSSLTSLATEELNEFEKLGEVIDRGGVDEEHREDFMQRLDFKQTKRAEENEKRERIASAKKKKQEELDKKKAEKAEAAEKLRKKKADEKAERMQNKQ